VTAPYLLHPHPTPSPPPPPHSPLTLTPHVAGIFWRPWRGSTHKFGKVVLAAMKMSNVLIDYPDAEFEDAAFADLEDAEQPRRPPQGRGWRRADGRARPPSGQRRRRDHAARDHSAIRDALKEVAREASYFRPGSSRA